MLLDHFFILTRKYAPEGDLLAELGLTEGAANDHPGQGTANRRFFFSNTALELLYVRDAEEAHYGPGKGLRFPERASNPEASPFGLVFRHDDNTDSPAFAGWRYQPEYFAPGISFLVAENSELLKEPLCICMPDNPPSGTPRQQSSAPFTTVTQLHISVPVSELSSVLKVAAGIECVQIDSASSHLMEIEFGHEAEGKHRDFRPNLPLIIRW